MTSFRSTARGRAVALAVGAGVIGSLALAGPSFADAPLAGVNCQVDGKVLGRGATFQRNAEIQAFIPGYAQNVCGPVPDASNATAMVLYNDTITGQPAGLPTWPSGTMGTGPLNGSGNGVTGNKCRADAFEGSDNPYTNAQLALTRGAPNLGDAGCVALSSDVNFNPVYEPGAASSSFPAATDTAAISPQAGTSNGAMSFPVAGAAVAVAANLSNVECPGIAGTRPITNFNGAELSAIFGGTITVWNDPTLVATSPELANCGPIPITRVVRLDSSGTSQQFRQYLAKADPAGAPNPRICDPAAPVSSWVTLKTQANTLWPTNPPAGTCPAAGAPGQLIRPATSGGQALTALVDSTVGAVGYADLSDWSTTTVSLANVAANVGGGFVNPAAATASNCGFVGASTPGAGNNGAVGLSPINQNWATDAVPNRSDVTFIGAGYPICSFTYVLVYTGLSGNAPATSNPISRLNADQRRNLYSYLLYVLSPAAQNRLTAIGYAQLPSLFRTRIAAGFDANF